MTEIIILEDSPAYQRSIQNMIPAEMSFQIVATSSELKTLLAQNPDTKIFILDDKVPSTDGERPDYHFLANAKTVLETKPDAQIWYTGSSPGSEEIKFCAEKKIRMITRADIRKIFIRELDDAIVPIDQPKEK